MLDIKFIRDNVSLVEEVIKNKGIKIDLNRLLALDKERRELIRQLDDLRSEQNKLGREDIEKAREVKAKIKEITPGFHEVEKEYNELIILTPNLYSEDTPIAKDESGNKEVSSWGKIPEFKFKIKDHIEIGQDLNILNLEKGVKTSGFRGYYLKNEGAYLAFALIWHSINKMKERGFSFMIPPTILKEFSLIGSGHFPFGKEEVYQIANPGRIADTDNKKENLYLGGTSEPSLLAYFSDTVLDEKDLPIKTCAFSQCYRSEAGSYGKDTKGLYRLHEFMKVEQLVLCKNDIKESNRWLEEMRKISEEILRELKLPYRVVQVCSGDMGAGKYKMYDIETWMPSRENYGETHSDSNLTDWQSRRLNIFYKNSKGEKVLTHALNNTVIASPRILIAILENYQQKDGSVKVPKILQKYIGKKEIKKRS